MAESGALDGELRRFLVEAHPLRGHHVRLGRAWAELRTVRRYPAAVEALLGETVAATVLLAATLKFEGRLTLQLKGRGCVTLLVAQCTHDFQLRGTASCAGDVPFEAGFAELVGDGQLVVTVETGPAGARYQGIVPMQSGSVAGCLEDYFMQSEQLPTRLRLQVHGDACAGLLLQKLPAPGEGEAEGAATQAVWEELTGSLAALPSGDLQWSTEQLLPRLMQAHDSRLFGATSLVCRCSCSRERVGNVLRSLGEAEARSVLAEQGSVTVDCDFCGRSWHYDPIDIERLFSGPTLSDTDRRIN